MFEIETTRRAHASKKNSLRSRPGRARPHVLLAEKVAIARDNRKSIELYTKSGKLYHQRAATRDQLRYIKTKAKSREERVSKAEEARKGEEVASRWNEKLWRGKRMVLEWGS